MEYLSIVSDEAALSPTKCVVFAGACAVGRFSPLALKDSFYDEGFKG